MRSTRFFPVIIISILLFIIACDNEVPVKELTNARVAIEQAVSVNAEKYAAEELEEAKISLMKAHEQLLKDEKPGDSAKSAGVSYDKAMEAYNKSLPFYSQDAIDRAETAISEADAVNAEKLAPVYFEEAKELYRQAGEEHKDREYLEAHSLAESSYDAAVKAKEESVDNRYKLGFQIGEVTSILRKIENYDYESYAPEEYALALEYLRKAENEYAENQLKNGFDSIETARINADRAYRFTMEGVTEERIEEAELVLAEAEDAKGDTSDEDYAAAREALDISKKLRREGDFEESLTYSNEAIRLGNMVVEDSKKVASGCSMLGSDKVQKDDDLAKDSSDDYTYYTVKSWEKYKDCLWRISGEYYKNPRLWRKIYNANRDRIKNPDLIKPGWVIRIPKLK
ncbi:MAG: LysM peptidoglycan-binding domain-containing protein [Spirochaetota bacterium]